MLLVLIGLESEVPYDKGTTLVSPFATLKRPKEKKPMKITIPNKVRINFGFRMEVPRERIFRKMVINVVVQEVSRALNKAAFLNG